MATNVNEAFTLFMANHVNLDPAETVTARGSRDWLATQLRAFHTDFADFPRPYEEKDIFYGSFHRRTKIRPLDDIDLIACLHAQGCTYLSYGTEIRLTVPQEAERLRPLCHDESQELNSRKVINQFVRRLSKIPQYRRADIGRNGEAAVLSLESYTWSFDIVPAFFTKPESDGRTYYLIPDANGHWKKTDPRIDQDRITQTNQAHDGNLLPVIRLMKYWNRRTTKPVIDSYVFETIVVNHFRASTSKATVYIDLHVEAPLREISSAILQLISDPKGIQGDLNQTSLGDRFAISTRATHDAARAVEARNAENRDDHKGAIRLWSEIFGPDFPAYG